MILKIIILILKFVQPDTEFIQVDSGVIKSYANFTLNFFTDIYAQPY